MNCIRCGRNEQIERHRIVPGIEGGEYTPENEEPLCLPCHKYEHVKRQCVDTLSRERTRRQNDGRVSFLVHRLQVIEKLNTPELIRERGTYQTYWIDSTTRKIPRWKPN
ncbi:hypothetical protein LCGC14_0393300, partial [marine sediment metagenome]